jgi:hypothetical protein
VLPRWDQALDAIGPDDEPLHVSRFGQRFDALGVIAGSRDAKQCIRYLDQVPEHFGRGHLGRCRGLGSLGSHDFQQGIDEMAVGSSRLLLYI